MNEDAVGVVAVPVDEVEAVKELGKEMRPLWREYVLLREFFLSIAGADLTFEEDEGVGLGSPQSAGT